MAALSLAQSISTGIALVAFLIAALLIAYRSRLRSRVDLVTAAPLEDRARVARETAQDLGLPTELMSPDQIFQTVQNVIKTRRFYAIIGFLVTVLISTICVIYIIIEPGQVVTQNVGPVSLLPGETKTVDLDLRKDGLVKVSIESIVPDWEHYEQLRADWEKAGRGLTPEIWLKVCGPSEDKNCQEEGVQRGIKGTFQRNLAKGDGTVTFFNFRDNPGVSLTTTIMY